VSTRYRERLWVAWWAWPVALATAAFFAAELGIGAAALRHPLTYVVVCGAVALGLAALGRIRIMVDGSELRVDDARLPLDVIADVRAVDAATRRDLLGRDADPLAFVIQRPWIPGGVRIDLDDPTDPTPYWYVSSRQPERLAAALRQASSVTRT
jgi:hypothetical protein